ncbi:hypothetical protein J7J63_05855 [Candidatus Bipolaricaulota bacterium]|nr:hypothetical protein [Candidatus Bipolaricaulota bacterium]
MPMYLGDKKLTCGYFGVTPLNKSFFGANPVCTSCSEIFPVFPAPNSGVRFSLMIKSTVDLMVAWRRSGRPSLISASSTYADPNWGLIAHGVDDDGNFDFELTCLSTIFMLQFVRHDSTILNLQLAKSVDHNGLPTRCRYYYAFIHLPRLKTFQMLPNVGAANNLCRMFWDDGNLQYVDLPKNLFDGGAIDYDSMFRDTPQLRFVSYISTRMTISGGRVSMFINSNPLRPSVEERSALMDSWGSRFQFDVCRMSDTNSWKRTPKRAFRYWKIDFGNKQYGGNHHSSIKELYAYSSVDGYEELQWTKGRLRSFSANQNYGTAYTPMKMLDRNHSTYYMTYHWGNGHWEWEFKTPSSFDSFRIQANGHSSTNAGDTAGHATGRDFIIEGRNSTSEAWVTVANHRVMDAGNYGNWSKDEYRTILIND